MEHLAGAASKPPMQIRPLHTSKPAVDQTTFLQQDETLVVQGCAPHGVFDIGGDDVSAGDAIRFAAGRARARRSDETPLSIILCTPHTVAKAAKSQPDILGIVHTDATGMPKSIKEGKRAIFVVHLDYQYTTVDAFLRAYTADVGGSFAVDHMMGRDSAKPTKGMRVDTDAATSAQAQQDRFNRDAEWVRDREAEA